MSTGFALGGRALHAGCFTSVVLLSRPGPLAIRQRRIEAPLSALHIVRADHGVVVEHQSLRVDLCEHALSALGGIGVEAALCLHVFGAEFPLLDGGACRIAQALRQLSLGGDRRRRRIVKSTDIQAGDSVYRFQPAPGVHLSVEIDFDHPLIEQKHASWEGDPDDYLERIAPARTFGFRRDAERLLQAGRARAVDFRSVVVLDDNGTSASIPLPTPDECVRHKLLDFIGDLTLDGGVPEGRITAYRPGHGATHAILAHAHADGVFEPAR